MSLAPARRWVRTHITVPLNTPDTAIAEIHARAGNRARAKGSAPLHREPQHVYNLN